MPSSALICVFFFQAEDGIRDFHVTGVQTCALPIYCPKHGKQDETFVCQHIVQGLREGRPYGFFYPASSDEKRPNARSEERRVGKECKSRWLPNQYKQNKDEIERLNIYQPGII